MKHFIYCTTNILNNKRYIGKHSTTNINDGYLGSGRIILQAIERYGREHFERKIIHVVENESELNYWEKYYIEKYNTIAEGYNITKGGEGVLGLRHSEETKQKISEQLKGQELPKSTKQKMSKAKKGKTPNNAGKKMSEESSDKKREWYANLPEEEKQQYKKKRTNWYANLSEEEKQKINEKRSKSMKGKPKSKETRDKIKKSLTGSKRTEETKRKISEKLKGNKNAKVSKHSENC